MTIRHKTFSAYQVLTAADVNAYLMDQAVVRIDTAGELTSVPANVHAAIVSATGDLYIREEDASWGTAIPRFNRPAYVATISERPTTGRTKGDQIFVDSQGQVYAWDGTRWRNGAAGDAIPSGSTSGSVVTGRTGSSTATVGAAGRALISIGPAFSANSFIAMGTAGSTGGSLASVVADPSNHTLSTAAFICYQPSGSLVTNGQVVRINWSVVGYND